MSLWDPCDLELDGQPCGSYDRVTRFLPGLRCHDHHPARLLGLEPPDPTGSVPAEPRPRPVKAYGKATSDPLGRTVPGTSRTGMIPRRPEDVKT